MALILEVLEARGGGVRARRRLDGVSLRVGRGLDNDLILDDPYVDPRHALIGCDEAGNIVVEDLGSVNGLIVAGTAERREAVVVRPGMQVRLGRTTLRFRDTAEQLTPALPDRPASPLTATRWLGTGWGHSAVVATAATLAALYAWLGSYERSAGTDALAGSLAVLMMGTLWAAVWAAASRIVAHRFNFGGHFAIVAGAMAITMVYFSVDAWVTFVLPQSPVWVTAGVIFVLAVFAAMIAAHLALASNLPRRSRWRAALVTSAVVGALGLALTYAGEEPYSDVPSFAGVLKPFPAAFLPTMTPEEFGDLIEELQEEVDDLAEEGRRAGLGGGPQGAPADR